MQLFYYEGFWVSILTQSCTSWYCPERKKERERVRLLSSLVPFVFSLGFVDDDKPLPEAKFHRLQSVNVEVGCCLLVPQYRTIFLWVFKVLVEKSKDFGLAYKVYFINLDSDISFGITFDVHKLQKKYFFLNGNHHFLPNSDDAEEILQSIRFEIPAKTKSEIAVITAVVKASLKRWFDLH